MDKQLAIFKISWENYLIYRLNFILWRLRNILQLFLTYFVWWTVFQSQQEVFGYTEGTILTYVMVASLIRAIILSSTAIDVSGHINQGSIVNFLIKPFSFVGYYFTRDLADKLFNISFVILEIILLVLLLRPQIQFQTDPMILVFFIISIILGALILFALVFTIGLLAFWVENSWAPWFLITIFLEGFGGGLFPIDILPKTISQIILLTPAPYLIYFPAKLYIGGLSTVEIFQGFFIALLWVAIMWAIMIKTLKAGLKYYTAVGN